MSASPSPPAKDLLSRVAFFASCLFLAGLYGFCAARYQWFPSSLLAPALAHLDADQRDAREATEGLRFFHQGLQSLESSVFKEASATLNEAGLPGLQDGLDAVQGCAFELRTYELQLGYDTVPNFLEIYSGGLEDKMDHDDSGV